MLPGRGNQISGSSRESLFVASCEAGLLMISNFSPDARLKGQHLRWHVGRGVQKPGCKFCMADGGPVAVPEPVAVPLIINLPPEPVEKPDPLQIPADSLAEAKRSCWKDSAWALAGNDLEASLAAKLLGCSTEFFHKEIESLFSMSWPETCELAMIQSLSDLQSAAIRQAKKGDFKAVQMLERSGLLPLFQFAKNRKEAESELRSLSDEELNQRLLAVVERRGLSVERTIAQSNLLQNQTLVELREPSEAEIPEVTDGGVFNCESKQVTSGSGLSSVETELSHLGLREQKAFTPLEPAVPSPPIKVSHQLETVNGSGEGQSNLVDLPPSVAMRAKVFESAVKPVVCNTDHAFGLGPNERQYSVGG